MLNSVRSKHSEANHHCNAYRINPNKITEYSSDDGEPSGTAGMPILNSLRSHNLINTGFIVVRYFGGTKLGKPGLIQAYRHCTEETVKTSTIKRVVPVQNYRIVYTYNQQSIIDKLKHDFSLHEKQTEYLEKITTTLACPDNEKDLFEKAVKKYLHLFITFDELQQSFLILK